MTTVEIISLTFNTFESFSQVWVEALEGCNSPYAFGGETPQEFCENYLKTQFSRDLKEGWSYIDLHLLVLETSVKVYYCSTSGTVIEGEFPPQIAEWTAERECTLRISIPEKRLGGYHYSTLTNLDETRFITYGEVVKPRRVWTGEVFLPTPDWVLKQRATSAFLKNPSKASMPLLYWGWNPINIPGFDYAWEREGETILVRTGWECGLRAWFISKRGKFTPDYSLDDWRIVLKKAEPPKQPLQKTLPLEEVDWLDYDEEGYDYDDEEIFED